MPRAPIVGSYFFPGATNFLKELPTSTPLTLFREPYNPVDPDAVRVEVAKSSIPVEVLHIVCQELGADPELLAESISLGYLRREFAPLWHTICASPAPQGTLTFSPEGKPQVKAQ